MNFCLIKEIRKEKQIKQHILAKKVNVTPAYISMLENGKKEPSLKVIKDICKVLEIKVSMLFKKLEKENTIMAELELNCPHCDSCTYHEDDVEWINRENNETKCMNCNKKFYFDTEIVIKPCNVRTTEEESQNE